MALSSAAHLQLYGCLCPENRTQGLYGLRIRRSKKLLYENLPVQTKMSRRLTFLAIMVYEQFKHHTHISLRPNMQFLNTQQHALISVMLSYFLVRYCLRCQCHFLCTGKFLYKLELLRSANPSYVWIYIGLRKFRKECRPNSDCSFDLGLYCLPFHLYHFKLFNSIKSLFRSKSIQIYFQMP